MPIKLKESVKRVERGTKRVTIEHHYMKCQSVETLNKELESCFTTDNLGREVTKKGKGTHQQKKMT